MKYARDLVGQNEIGVNKVCELFKISKKTYYQCEEPNERFSRKYSNIKRAVEKVIKKNSKYGVLRIKAALKEDYGIIIGRDALARLLNIWGLNLKRKIKKTRTSLIRKILIKLSSKANILIRKKITKPFKAITSDISELEYKGGRAYLCVHKDVFGQMVYGFELSLKMDLALVMSSFKKAKRRTGKNKLIWHQDQGSQYTSYRYIQSVLEIGRISFSKKGTPTDNPGQESFFGRFKEENKIEFGECETFEKLKKLVKEKMKYYNNERIHTTAGYMTPRSFTESLLKAGSNWFTKGRG